MHFKRIFEIAYGLLSGIALIALAVGFIMREPDKMIPPASALSALEQRLDASAQTLAQVNRTLAQLENKQSRLETTQRRLSQAMQNPAPSPQTLIMNTALEPASTAAQAEDPFKTPEQGSGAERLQFTAESHDADWSLATEASILSTLTDFNILDIELDTAECYQSGCQLEFKHLTEESNELLIEQLQSSEAFAGEFFARTIIDDDGMTRTIIVVGRADDILLDEIAF